MTKLIYWLSMGVIAIALILLLYAAYLLLYPFKPFVLRTDPPKVLTKRVVAGEDLIYQVDYCRHGIGSGKVARTIVGTTFIPTPSVETVTKEGCGTNTIHLPVPEGATPGKYHVEIVADFKLSPLRIITVRFSTEEFEIVSNDRPTIINNTSNKTTITNTATTETPVIISPAVPQVTPQINSNTGTNLPPTSPVKVCVPLTNICL